MLFTKEKQKSLPPEISLLKTMTALGQNHEAVEFAKDLLEKDSHKDWILFYQGVALENEGNVQQATEQYEKSIKVNPDLAPVLVRLGQIYLQRTDAATARTYLLKAAKIIKNDPGIIHSLGLVAHIEGDEKKAVKYWKKAVRIDKKYAPAFRLCRSLQYKKLQDIGF